MPLVIEASGVQLYEPVFGMFFAMGAPASRSPPLPLRSTMVTVPLVVGCQVRVAALPALKPRPAGGMTNAFGWPGGGGAAAAGDAAPDAGATGAPVAAGA